MTKYLVTLTSNSRKEIEAQKVSLSGDYLTFTTEEEGIVLAIRHEFVISFQVVK